jgi:hypothetical protein
MTVGADLQEVVNCIETNRPFAISDGFARLPLREIAEIAENTPSEYIGIVTERAFASYPDAHKLHYVRGSSGFAGFCKGGFSRAAIVRFHQEMETLVGARRWREWGSEQCGSNFAISNSPGAVVLPFPSYASFTDKVLREKVKFFHFIGRFRFYDGYYGRRGREVIAGLLGGAAQSAVGSAVATTQKRNAPVWPFARYLTPESLPKYAAWRLSGRGDAVTIQIAARTEFRNAPAPGPRIELRPAAAGKSDLDAAKHVYARAMLLPPAWIPPELVTLVVDLGAGAGSSCLWWLANYWRTEVVAYEPRADWCAQARRNVELNSYGDRFSVLPVSHIDTSTEVVGLLTRLSAKRIDILKLNVDELGARLLEDPGFHLLDVRTVVLTSHGAATAERSRRARCAERLRTLGFATYADADNDASGAVWGYRQREAWD